MIENPINVPVQSAFPVRRLQVKRHPEAVRFQSAGDSMISFDQNSVSAKKFAGKRHGTTNQEKRSNCDQEKRGYQDASTPIPVTCRHNIY